MKKLTKLIFALICILCIQNCKDDDFNTTGDTTSSETEAVRDQQFKTENFGNATTAKFIGSITDTSGNKLENVQIIIGNTTTLTNNNGLFILNDVDVFENFAYIKAQKEGYINGSRVVLPKTDGVNIINIVLFQKDVVATVNSGETSQVSLPNGAEVNFGGDFTTATGEAYTGPVDVVLHYITPNSEETFTQMPGSLFAQTATNEASALETYGMLSVNLFSPAGEALNINSNTPARIEFPVDESQTNIAPETINLWYFDEENGYWKEEGQAVKEGNKYVAEVTHFTWWNCDIPFDSIDFCFSINPLHTDATIPYYVVITRVSNNQIIYAGDIYAYNVECGLVPNNEEISINIYSSSETCNTELIHSETLGGYTTDTTVDISFTEEVTSTSITGIATNCDGDPIINGYVYIDSANTFSITDGTIDIAYLNCSPETIIIQVLDFDTGTWAIINNVTVNGNAVNLGTISTCDDTGGTYNGNVVLVSQEDVNNFGLFGFTSIDGNLLIRDSLDGSTNITDLTPLATLENIFGELDVVFNPLLQNLNGLHNITTIDGFSGITNNESLTNLDGLSSLTNVRNLVIVTNPALTSITGLSNLTTIDVGFSVAECNSLVSLAGLEGITSLRSLEVDYNNGLTSISALQNLTSLEKLFIEGNNALTNLVGLEQITALEIIRIADNNGLMSLNGLENLVYVEPNSISAQIYIGVRFNGANSPPAAAPNPDLTDLCALQNLFVNGNGTDPNIEIFIENNAYNPTPQDIINGNCSQ
ncbi:leucine-rich repeat domain-containing protein [uncultured Kordia sp.]|uniref:leucine-rich repeat domain-containing protein n=1 Tax=uncultured Kordia sp. TaxID=507699 RepID=UPI0026119AE1|nr:leucine-rich repeat domain-containing protein [uncultured Kordia sp.]